MKKMDKKKMKGPVEMYMELRQGVKKFSFYKKFNPCEPHDPLGNLYNGIFTAATQTLFSGCFDKESVIQQFQMVDHHQDSSTG